MEEININTLVNKNNYLIENIPNNIIITGEIVRLNIEYKYDQLDLLKVECDELYYKNQEEDSIKNHILPNSLKELDCSHNNVTYLPNLPDSLKILWCENNKLTSLPKLPNSLKKLYCINNKLISLPDLPKSLGYLNCSNNQLISLPNLPDSIELLKCVENNLISLPNLPNSLKELWCQNNKLTSLPNLPALLKELYCNNNRLKSLPYLPNSLKFLYCSDNQIKIFSNTQIPNSLCMIFCDHNQLISLPDFSHIDHNCVISFIQDTPISYIPYNKNIKLYNEGDNKMIIEGYPHNPIMNQIDLNQYMEFIKNHQLNRIKSARK